MSHILTTAGINNVFVEGCVCCLRIPAPSYNSRNVHRRNNAIGAFKDDDQSVRVIMLSLESAASGTNLMEATHVILLGTCCGE